MEPSKYTLYRLSYHNRIFTALIIVLFVMILLFKFISWEPASRSVTKDFDDVVQIDEVLVTRQDSDVTPPPQRPRVGPPEIRDEILEDEPDLDFPIESPADFPEPAGVQGVIENPEQPARLRRIVEAVTPEGARTMRSRVDVHFRVLVNEEGRVEEVEITGIFEHADHGLIEIDAIGYGILEEAKRAAKGWLFFPAQQDGKPVKTYSEHRFSFSPLGG